MDPSGGPSSSGEASPDGGGVVYDVGVVGAGITGLMATYFLSGLGYRVVVFEAKEGPGLGVTGAQSEVVHVVQLPFGSRKSRLAREGNPMFDEICVRLGVPFKRTCALLVVRSRLMLVPLFFAYLYLGLRLGSFGRMGVGPRFKVGFVGRRGLRRLEPNVSDDLAGALVVWGYGLVDSRRLVLELHRHLAASGVDFKFGCEVLSGKHECDVFSVETNMGRFTCRCVVNAAGLYADEVASRFGVDCRRITPGVGVMAEYGGVELKCIVSPFTLRRDERTKGGGAIPTVRGTYIFGPNLRVVSDKRDASTSEADLAELEAKFAPLLRHRGTLLRVYAGVRPLSPRGDFELCEHYAGRLINLVGIESPGLTASPALGRLVAEKLRRLLGPPQIGPSAR